ncbi:lytic murein transglycosylase B [Halovibrio sp. HP20-50]|uniref:lytic murein transglycosylase B n=1 Tax=Halovibrio sp. HP20-59 TaxID=3080275 RepID=UPI00294B8573|nr:lytic murein transglycosylase B [Halovibrio sp. HP20-59]MEA2119315.1 lytic murein transglycosylase B [Halovibrio sp. HP20-59]
MNRVQSKTSRYLLAALMCLATSASFADSPSSDSQQHVDPQLNADSQALVDELVEQGMPQAWLEEALGQASYTQSVLDAMEGAAERRLRWYEYRDIFITQQRIEEGVAFINAHADDFARAESSYGVPADVIAAIIGVETYYGRHKGQHRVLDSLATLAFHHPSRGAFFRGELAAFLRIAYEQQVDPSELQGSYAGAMGYPQFIPTSYQAYAVDFDGDGLRDLWENPIDAIGSVANYFAEHGWKPGEAIYHQASGPAVLPVDTLQDLPFNQTVPPKVSVAQLADHGITPKEPLENELLVMPLALEFADGETRYRLGEYNFYVITRYNHSHLYAMAVAELAEAIAELRNKLHEDKA